MSLLNATNRFNTFMSGMSPEANLGLLTGGLSLLGGEPIGKAINTGMGMYSNLQGFGDKTKQRSAIKELEEKFKDQPEMLALLKANPTSFIQALTTSTLSPKTPVANFVSLTNAEKIAEGLPTYVVAQKNTSTGEIKVKNPFSDVNLDVLQSLQATNQPVAPTVEDTNVPPTVPTETDQTATSVEAAPPTVPPKIVSYDAKAGTVTVQDPNSPTGLKIIPIEGGEAELQIRKADEDTRKINKAGKLYYKNLNKRVGVLNREIDKALKILEPHDDWRGGWGMGTGAGFGSLLSFIPTTEAKELEAVLSTISGIVGFERLGEMRNESVSGGALGAINTKELELLTGSQGSLKQDLRPKTLRGNLLKLRSDYAETQVLADIAYQEQFGTAPPDRLTEEDEADLTNFTPIFREMMGGDLTDDQLQRAWSSMPFEQRNLFK